MQLGSQGSAVGDLTWPSSSPCSWCTPGVFSFHDTSDDRVTPCLLHRRRQWISAASTSRRERLACAVCGVEFAVRSGGRTLSLDHSEDPRPLPIAVPHQGAATARKLGRLTITFRRTSPKRVHSKPLSTHPPGATRTRTRPHTCRESCRRCFPPRCLTCLMRSKSIARSVTKSPL